MAEFRIRLAKMQKDREIAKRTKLAAELAELMAIPLVTCSAQIYDPAEKFTVKKLEEQLKILKARCAGHKTHEPL